MGDPMGMSGDPVPVPLHSDQIEQAADMLARAFLQDPFARFVFPDAQRRSEHLPAFVGRWVRDGLRDGEVFTLGPDLAVAIWMPSHATPAPEPGAAEAAEAAELEATRLLTADEQERLERFVGQSRRCMRV